MIFKLLLQRKLLFIRTYTRVIYLLTDTRRHFRAFQAIILCATSTLRRLFWSFSVCFLETKLKRLPDFLNSGFTNIENGWFAVVSR